MIVLYTNCYESISCLSELTGCLHKVYTMFYISVQPLRDLVAQGTTTHGEQAILKKQNEHICIMCDSNVVITLI